MKTENPVTGKFIDTDLMKEYDPLHKKMFQVIDNDGQVINSKWLPEISDKKLLRIYKNMVYSRLVDAQIISYQRQGRLFTYPPSYGQEAIAVATGEIMRKDDWLVPAYRELGAYLAKGVTLGEIFHYYMGNEKGSNFKHAINMLPFSVPIASQLLHATGIGYEINYRKKNQVVFAFVGDGGTSQGDFHEALNFAGVWNAPVIFMVQNNQYGISTSVKKQTAAESLALKSVGYGIRGIQVDGNDVFALYRSLQQITESVRNGEGPVLVEAVTYRKGAHTTSDDPGKYRTKEEEIEWDKKDPLGRLRKYLESKDLWNEKEELKIRAEFKKEIDKQFLETEKEFNYPLEDIYQHMYVDLPDDLLEQKAEHEQFLQWKEGRS